MARAFAEIAFTPAVRAEQARQGSAGSYAKFLDADAAARDSLGAAEAAFVAERDGFYQATVGETGWPYVQFRDERSEEHTSELQSLMRISYAVFCLKKKKIIAPSNS